MREITDGSVQELLQKLLRAESVIAERKRRSYNRPPGQEHQGRRSRGNERPPTNGTTEGAPGATGVDKNTSETNQPALTGFRGEANRLHIKYFNFHKKGPLAANCPEPTRKRKNKTGESA